MTTFIKRITRYSWVVACAVSLAAMVLQPGVATAGACTETTRDGNMTAAQLSFRNATSGELTIKFYRGLIGNNDPKKTQTIGAGERAQYNFVAKGPYENVNPTALLAIGGSDVMRCSFTASNSRTSAGLGKTHWKEGSCVALAVAAETCPTCTTSCEKSYATGKTRWETQFTFTNPSGG
jgi:hypothetical protein